MKAKTLSAEHRLHIAQSLKGEVPSKETRLKISDSLKKRISHGYKPGDYWLGKKMPEHVGRAQRIRMIGNKLHLGHTHNDITKQLLSNQKKLNPVKYWSGKRRTDETKNRIRAKRLDQVVPTKDTYIELVVQNALHIHNIVYEGHKPIIGQPDIFIEPDICIFCDGDYWHGNPSRFNDSNAIIIGNETVSDRQKKDSEVNEMLRMKGYKVIRLRESDILDNLDACIHVILETIKNVKPS